MCYRKVHRQGGGGADDDDGDQKIPVSFRINRPIGVGDHGTHLRS